MLFGHAAGVAFLAAALWGCHPHAAPRSEPDHTAWKLAKEYVAVVDQLSDGQARLVMGCLPTQWAHLESAPAMVAAMQMDDAARAELRPWTSKVVGETHIIEWNWNPLPCDVKPADCCVSGYFSGLYRWDNIALGHYLATCEAIDRDRTGYLGCLPLVTLIPHVTATRPEWMPNLSRADRVRIAAYAFSEARSSANGGRK